MSAEGLVVVTGGAGHVGSHVVEALVADGRNRVVSLDNYSSGTPSNHVPGAEYIDGHTKDIAALVRDAPKTVFHLGEYARIAPSFEDVQQVFEQNAVGTFAVAQFCRDRGSKLVYAGSSTRFADGGAERHKNPYSFTKAVNVDLINNYIEWYGLDAAIAYFNNAYGPREKREGSYVTLVGACERAYLNGETMHITRPGTQRRNFTYVKDLARGIIRVGEAGHGDGYVLGHPDSYAVTDIVDAFGLPYEFTDEYAGRAKSGEMPTKAWDELGWRPTVGVLDYIADFVASNPRGSA